MRGVGLTEIGQCRGAPLLRFGANVKVVHFGAGEQEGKADFRTAITGRQDSKGLRLLLFGLVVRFLSVQKHEHPPLAQRTAPGGQALL